MVRFGYRMKRHVVIILLNLGRCYPSPCHRACAVISNKIICTQYYTVFVFCIWTKSLKKNDLPDVYELLYGYFYFTNNSLISKKYLYLPHLFRSIRKMKVDFKGDNSLINWRVIFSWSCALEGTCRLGHAH